jgi:hypothetical protein
MRPIALGVLSVLVAHTATAYSTVSSQSPGTDTRASGAGSEVPGRFGLRLAVDPLPQVLQLNRRLCHPAPASHVVQGLPTVGRLRSAGITPPPRYCTPIRHPLAFGPLPGVAGYRAYLAPGISPRGETGFSSCLACPCPHAVATHPAEVAGSSRSAFDPPCCLRLRVAGSAFGLRTLEAIIAFTVVTAWGLATFPGKALSTGFRILVSRHPAIPATGPLTLTPAGLSPAEHASLRWTHNPACRFPAPGFPADFTPRVMGPIALGVLSAPVARRGTH